MKSKNLHMEVYALLILAISTILSCNKANLDIKSKTVQEIALSNTSAKLSASATIKLYITDPKFGAVGNGITLNTIAIQKAIDSCAKLLQGGTLQGSVIIPSGNFLTGTLYLKTNVNLFMDANSVLLGSTDTTKYPINPRFSSAYPYDQENKALIYAQNVNNISVTGSGTINGNGHASSFFQPPTDNGNGVITQHNPPNRPKLVYFVHCSQVNMEGITLTQPAYWTQHYVDCNNVYLTNLNVYSHANFNNDGIDIESTNVTVSNCNVDSDDDGICFKSERNISCQHVKVNACTVKSDANPIKFGTATRTNISDVNISNITITPCSTSFGVTYYHQKLEALSGIAVEEVDGGVLNGVTIDQVTMNTVQTPIFIRLANRSNAVTGYPPTALTGITISNIRATNVTSQMCASITGTIEDSAGDTPGSILYPEGITLKNIYIEALGGGTAQDAAITPPESPRSYPENHCLGTVYPAYGIYVRHAKTVTMDSIILKVPHPVNEYRPAIILDDVHTGNLDRIYADQPLGTEPKIKQLNSIRITVTNLH